MTAKGQRQAFVLGRQNEKHEHNRQNEDEQGCIPCRLLLEGQFRPLEGNTLRQHTRRQFLHRSQRLRGRDTGSVLAL